ncbi:unnamed protein product, partial [Meganyctiphanes norvegica]
FSGSNKLSRKTVKQTCDDTSNKENEETTKRCSKKLYTRDVDSRITNLNDNGINRRESSQNSKLSSKASTTSASLPKENQVETNSTSTVCALSLQRNSESSSSSERRESVFTDIDDGSFIEFCDIPAKTPISESKKPPSSLYYTLESQNDTQYSTSTKMSNAAVGFKKYVDAVKNKRALLDAVTEDVDEDPGSTNKNDNFLSDYSIVGGSADILPNHHMERKNTRGALNSTMMPTAYQPLNLPDISTLTLETEQASSSDTNNQSPAASPNYIRQQAQANKIDTITISESSSEEESFMTANKSPYREEESNNHKVNNSHKNENNLHVELEATCDSSTSRSVGPTPKSESLISEDVSIVSSVAPQCKAQQPSIMDAPTVVFQSVSVLQVPLRRSERRSKEKYEKTRNESESKNNTDDNDSYRSKSPIYIKVGNRSKITQRKRSKRNSKMVSESDNPSNSSDNQFKSSRVNNKKISESDDFSDDILRSPRSNNIQTMCTSNLPGNKKQIVNSEKRKKSRSGKVAKVASDSSEENYAMNLKGTPSNVPETENSLNSSGNILKDRRYAKRSEEVSDIDNNLKRKSKDTKNTRSKYTGLISESDDNESKPSPRKNKHVVEESDASSYEAPKKVYTTGKDIRDVINESDEISFNILPVPKNTPNKYIWKIEN